MLNKKSMARRTFCIFFSFVLFLACAPARGSVIRVASVREGLAKFADLNAQDLVVCDIDGTLAAHHDPQKKIPLHERTYYALDAALPALLKALQEKGVPVVALTHMSTGKRGAIPSMEEWRYNILSKLGFTFSFNQTPEKTAFTSFKEPRPSCYKGIIASAHHNKGTVLKAFLELKKLNPKRIFFFDDRLRNILDMRSTFRQRPGLHCFHIQTNRTLAAYPCSTKTGEAYSTISSHA
ncbi:DUF2608 domain-containing protein [bacterium]|nr:DUF2608 domain-containing protein [bacterium]